MLGAQKNFSGLLDPFLVFFFVIPGRASLALILSPSAVEDLSARGEVFSNQRIWTRTMKSHFWKYGKWQWNPVSHRQGAILGVTLIFLMKTDIGTITEPFNL